MITNEMIAPSAWNEITGENNNWSALSLDERADLIRFLTAALALLPGGPVGYQARVNEWMLTCFGAKVAADIKERPHRFLEEALELGQSVGCTKCEAMQLVDYVFGRPAGERAQEVGGTVLTLASLCTTIGVDMLGAAETELARVSTPEMIAKLQAKNMAKDPGSPLPGFAAPAPQPVQVKAIHPQMLHELECAFAARLKDTKNTRSEPRTRNALEAIRSALVSAPTDASEIAAMKAENERWLPIDQADRTIVNVQEFQSVGITLRSSDRYWVRDGDGRVYEASWSEGNNGRDYWWDWDAESPVDPVEFMPHPLDPQYHALSAPVGGHDVGKWSQQ